MRLTKPSVPRKDLSTISLPSIHKHQCKNNWLIYHNNNSAYPLVSIRLLINGGLVSSNKGGVPSLTDALIAHHFHTNWEKYPLSGTLHYTTNEQYSSFGLDGLNSEWRNILRVMKTILSVPQLDMQFMNHLLSVRQQSIQHQKNNPQILLKWAAQELMYKGTVLQMGPMGTIQSLKQINEIDIEQSTSKYKNPSGSLIVTGDVNIQEVICWVEDNFPAMHPKPPSDISLSPSTGVFHLEHPTSQSLIRHIQTVSAAPNHSFANEILSLGLGDLFTSRLNQRLRVQEGITYGISSNIWEVFSYSFFLCQCSVEKSSEDFAINLIQKTINEADKKWSEQECVIALQYLGQQLLEMSNTPQDLADLIENWLGNGHSIVELNQVPQQLREFSVEQIISAAQQMKRNKPLTIVVGGTKKNTWKSYTVSKDR
jgi:zinc protease